jgi:phage terminase large subunit-like protein
LVWLLKSGRGAGKTRTGAEFTHRMSEATGRIAIVAATGADVRDVCLEGESGILTIAPPGGRPHYEPSKRRLTWPNGCVATTFSAEEPDRLRGPEHGYAWLDEPAHYALIQDVWDNLMFGLRIGRRPRVVATTTPKPRPWLKRLIADARTRVSTVSTYANIDNLAPTFAEQIIAKYEGTRLGRQEIAGEVLEDVEGALWNYALCEATRVAPMSVGSPFDRIVVGVDPAGSSRVSADETAIIVCGLMDGEGYVLDDRSGHYTPHGWAMAVHAAYEHWNADAVVAEINFGAEMVTSQLRLGGYTDRLITVHARKAKDVRAEPIVGLWEQGKAHLAGQFPELERQMTEWVPYAKNQESPDRLDAMVYAMTVIATRPGRATFASPVQLDYEEPGIPALNA